MKIIRLKIKTIYKTFLSAAALLSIRQKAAGREGACRLDLLSYQPGICSLNPENNLLRLKPLIVCFMNMRKALTPVLLLLILSFSSAATDKDLQKKFWRAVDREDYDLVLFTGEPLTRQLIADKKIEEASLTYREMASACFFQGKFSQAVAYCSSGLALLNDMQPPSVAFRHTSTMAECYTNLSLIDSARYWFVKSEELLEKYPGIQKQAGSFVKIFYNNLGDFHLQQQDTQQALLYYRKTLAMALEEKDRRAIGIAYNSVANYYNQILKYDQAETYYQKAAGYFERNSIDYYWILLSLATNEFDRKSFTKSLLYARSSMDAYRQAIQSKPGQEHLLLEKRLLILSAECHLKLGLLDEAEVAYQQCLRILETSQNNRSEESAYCHLGLGRIFEARKKPETALDFYQKALIASTLSFQDYSFQNNPPVGDALSGAALVDILIQKAKCLQELSRDSGHTDSHDSLTFYTYLLAIEEAEKLRINMSAEISKLFFAEKLRPVFDSAIALGYLLSRQKQPEPGMWIEKTIALLERSRRVMLSDVLHERHIKPRAIPSPMLEEEALLQKNITEIKVQYVNTSDTIRQNSLRTSLRNLQITHRKLLRQMEHYNPGYISLRHEEQAIDISKIRAELNADQALLGYYVAENDYYIYVITRHGSQISQFTLPRDFYTRLRQLLHSLTTDPLLYSFEGTETVEWLYTMLIAPMLGHLRDFPRWLILRDGMLNLIPFEILREKGKKETLTMHYAIAYQPGIDLSPGNNGTITNMVGFAPYYKTYPSDSLPSLPHSEKEIRTTSRLLFLGPEATKEQFLKLIGQADALHLATHAQYNDSLPENSYLSFSPSHTGYRLYAHEIANLPLEHIKLAILSFCDAERGKVHHGEGILSLARSFRLAGCPRMLATLWKADDEITSYLVEAFYKYLSAGSPPDIALQKARTDYFSSELGSAHNHPYYWANIVYIGDTAPLFSPALPWAGKLVYYSILPLFLLLLAFRHFRRRSKQLS